MNIFLFCEPKKINTKFKNSFKTVKIIDIKNLEGIFM